MNNAKKSVRHDIQQDANSDAKKDKPHHEREVNGPTVAENQTIGPQDHKVESCRSNEQINPIHMDEPIHKNIFNKILRSSKEQKEVKIIFNVVDRQTLNNNSHQMIRGKLKQQSPSERNIGSHKIRPHHFKQPQWLKSRKKYADLNLEVKHPKQEAEKYEYDRQEVGAMGQKCELAKGRSGSAAFLTVSSINSAKYLRDRNEEELHQSRFYSKQSVKMEQYEISNIRLEEQIKQLRFKLENLEEDNNILLCRMQTLETELNLSNKKLGQYLTREENHRLVQARLKQKIEDLQSKLVLAKDQINSKNQLHDSGFNEGFSNILNSDKEVVHKKNEQISRLNEIINKTRMKVNQLNHLLGLQRINHVQSLHSLEQKYELKIEKQEKKIKKLHRIMEYRREKGPLVFAHQARHVTEDPTMERSPDQQISKVFPANLILRNLPFRKSHI